MSHEWKQEENYVSENSREKNSKNDLMIMMMPIKKL